MASQFIGLHMEVVLREPSGYRLTGIVRDVEAGSSLTLTDGTYYSPLLRSFFFFLEQVLVCLSCVTDSGVFQSALRPRAKKLCK